MGIEYNCAINGVCYDCLSDNIYAYQESIVIYGYNNGNWDELDIAYGEIILYECNKCGMRLEL